ncbi:hypothetical protein KPL74_18950 [Bacillus sp. NP157]|nr:hypothetical protein KPL74_18950 [Bacillus sp. NP157]
MPTKHTWLALLALLFACTAQAESHLVATLRDTTPAGITDRVLVTLSLENTGDMPVHFYTPMTPFIVPYGELSKDMFEVKDAFGHRVTYTGGISDFGPPPMKLFRLLQPGERLEQEVDLAPMYDFGNGGPFTISYTLRPDAAHPDPRVTSDEERQAFRQSVQRDVASNVLTVLVSPYRHQDQR